MGKYIVSPLTLVGVPQTSLVALISIYMLDSATPTTVTSGAAMVEVGGGWYSYAFSDWNHTKKYLVIVDGTDGIANNDERYISGVINGTAEEGEVIVLKPAGLRALAGK